MLIKVDNEKCNGCGVCISACPVEAMTLLLKVKIDVARCTGCRICLAVCPERALRLR